MDSNKLKLRLDDISEVNPALTCYHRDDPAPVLPLREEPDLLSWLENTGTVSYTHLTLPTIYSV